MSRRYKYVSSDDPNFLPMLNQELEDLDRRIDEIETQRVFLAGPSTVGTGRRDALVRYKTIVPSAGSSPDTVNFVIPLSATNCVEGDPKFKIVDWVGPVMIQENLTIADTITGLVFRVTNANAQNIRMEMVRETSAAPSEWDFFIMFRVSGVV